MNKEYVWSSFQKGRNFLLEINLLKKYKIVDKKHITHTFGNLYELLIKKPEHRA